MTKMPWRASRLTTTAGAAMLVLAFASAASADPTTYDQALSRAAASAPSLKARAATTASARSLAVAADRLPDPTLDIGFQNFPVTGPNAGSFTRDDYTTATFGFRQTFLYLSKRRARGAKACADVGIALAA